MRNSTGPDVRVLQNIIIICTNLFLLKLFVTNYTELNKKLHLTTLVAQILKVPFIQRCCKTHVLPRLLWHIPECTRMLLPLHSTEPNSQETGHKCPLWFKAHLISKLQTQRILDEWLYLSGTRDMLGSYKTNFYL